MLLLTACPGPATVKVKPINLPLEKTECADAPALAQLPPLVITTIAGAQYVAWPLVAEREKIAADGLIAFARAHADCKSQLQWVKEATAGVE
jgi:hypothetical protein